MKFSNFGTKSRLFVSLSFSLSFSLCLSLFGNPNFASQLEKGVWCDLSKSAFSGLIFESFKLFWGFALFIVISESAMMVVSLCMQLAF